MALLRSYSFIILMLAFCANAKPAATSTVFIIPDSLGQLGWGYIWQMLDILIPKKDNSAYKS